MKIFIRLAFAALLAAFGSTGWGQTNTFYKFAPATGVLKGSSTSYVTTAAVAADIKGLWTGTCDATTFLRGDGACASASSSPGGSNTQVQFNNSGVFGGSSNFTWDNTNNALVLDSAAGAILMSNTAKPFNLLGGNGLVDTTSSSLFLGSNGSSGAGGAINITAGSGATSGGGGGVAINAGSAAGSLMTGGSISLSTGTGAGGGTGGVIGFYTNGNVTARAQIASDGGITVGSPTGGDKGLGSINAGALYVNGAAVGTGSGTVTSITAGTGLTGGTITTSGTIALSTPVSIANGGTGQASANAALNALLPSQTGNSGLFLTTNGTNTSWAQTPIGTISFILQSTGASNPTVVSCNRCSSPSASRSGTGSWVLTPGVNIPGGSVVLCTLNSPDTSIIQVAGSTSSTTVILHLYNSSGALTDPSSGVGFQCAAGV